MDLELLTVHPFHFKGARLEVTIRECAACDGHPEVDLRSAYYRALHGGENAPPVKVASIMEALGAVLLVVETVIEGAPDWEGTAEAFDLLAYVGAWGRVYADLRAARVRELN
jgi:hypothetical protein